MEATLLSFPNLDESIHFEKSALRIKCDESMGLSKDFRTFAIRSEDICSGF